MHDLHDHDHASSSLILGSKTKDNVEQNPVEHSPTDHTIHHLPLPMLHGQLLQDHMPGELVPERVRPKHTIRRKLVLQQPLVRVLHGGDHVHPLPCAGHVVGIQKVAAKQEEESREGDDSGVPEYVVGHHRANEDNEGVGGEERNIENNKEVDEGAAKGEGEPYYGGVGGSLDS